ncbi:PAS domain S-box protein [candidate division TA06 bacterium]|nr:PAS domain S-box protein [candidate division TA06 bacterium]
MKKKPGERGGTAIRKGHKRRAGPVLETLHNGEKLYRTLLEMSPDAVYLSQKGIIIEANQAAAVLFGLKDPGQLAGRPLMDFAHPDSRPLIGEREKILFSGESEIPMAEEKLVHPDGSIIHVEVKSRSFLHRGQLLVQSVARDITDRRKVEQELVRFKRQMEYMLGATRTAVAVINSELDITYLSPSWESKFGPVSGQKCHQYFERKERPCRPCRIMAAIESGKTVVIEEPQAGDPGRIVQVHIVPFQDESGQWMAAEFTIDITDLKQVQTELARRQLELLTLLDNIPAGVFFKDSRGRYILANRNFCQTAGIAQEKLPGRTDEDIFPKETARRNRENEAWVLSCDHPQLLGESEAVQDGRQVTLEMMMVPVRDERGVAQGIIGIQYNITERKQAEEQVRMSALQWQTTFDAMNEGIALVDDLGVVQRCNRALAKILGRPEGEIAGALSRELLSEGEVQAGPNSMDDLPAGRERVRREIRFGERWLSLTIDPILDREGEPAGSVFILRDVTEVRQAQETTRLMVQAIEQMEEGVMIYDTSDRIVYVNPAMERITGYARDEMIGRSEVVPQQHLTPEFLEYWRKVWEQVAANRFWRGSKRSVRKDGTAYEQELVASVVRNQNSEIISYLVVVRDVTEQKRLVTIAEAVNNMNNIGVIFSGVRHELGNPVNSIKTATSILRDGFDTMKDGAKREYLERIISDVQRLEALLKVLHSFSMFEDLSLGPVELCAFIRDLMPTVEPDFEKAGIRFDYQFPGNACPVLADRRALYQIVVNLLTNAFNALRGRENPGISIRVVCGSEAHRIELEDNGTGMSDEVKDNIFKPFYTNRPGGTGLGMVICQKLVLAMKGYIEVESVQGRGTRVSVTLPRAGSTEATEDKG